ncbi:DUF5673 domain-containing protein [uncultured Parvimonas sp.]|uniref:DUF5673 domain-containing protein n=1 Tax=uncultured Parvimonas sp. TaxID=747372 RepID=UPI002805D9F7|nr:DUF5673 domain-containing protein [uncultured Parvimonas sp.]
MNSGDLLLIVFGVVLIFVIKKIVAMFQTRKKLEGEISTIKLRGRTVLLALSISLVGFGVVYTIKIRDIYSIVYILIGLCYCIVSLDKLYIAENGFCFDGKFAEFKKIKKWTPISNKFYEVVVTGDMKDETLTIPLDKENSEKLSIIIKQNKARPKAKK